MHKIVLIVIFILGFVNGIHAQEKNFEYADSSLLDHAEAPAGDDGEVRVVETKKRDTALHIHAISISQDTIRKWKNEKDIPYLKDLDSLLKAKQQEEMNASKAVDDTSTSFFQKLWASGILQLLFWAVAISFVIFIVYRLFLNNGVFKKNTTSRKVNEVAEEIKENTLQDYDRLISQAYKLEDYRLAVRYLFLKILLNLSEKEYLHLSVDKTNFQYVQEMQAAKRTEFAGLVLNYEYVWYGDLKINREQFSSIEKKFTGFYNKI